MPMLCSIGCMRITPPQKMSLLLDVVQVHMVRCTIQDSSWSIMKMSVCVNLQVQALALCLMNGMGRQYGAPMKVCGQNFKNHALHLIPASLSTISISKQPALFPDNLFSQYTTARDTVQTGFYFLMGQIGWSVRMQESITQLTGRSIQFPRICGWW